MKTAEEKLTISLDEFVKYLVKKWKMVCAIVVICVGLFAGTAIMLGEEIHVPHSEEYLHYEQELAWHEDYFEKSILMNLDPTSIHQRELLLRNITDKEILKNYAVSYEIWDEFETSWDKTYISELVVWNENETDGSVSLTLKHATTEECLEAAEYLKAKLLQKDSSLEVIICEEKIVKDDKLQEEHSRWYDRMYYVSSLLLDSRAGYTLKVSVPAAVVVGALSGGVFAVVTAVGTYLWEQRRRGK